MTTMNNDELKKEIKEEIMEELLDSKELEDRVVQIMEDHLGDLTAIREYNETNIFN